MDRIFLSIVDPNGVGLRNGGDLSHGFNDRLIIFEVALFIMVECLLLFLTSGQLTLD